MLKIDKQSGKLLRVPRLGLRTQPFAADFDLRRMIAGNPEAFLSEIDEKLFLIGTDIGRDGAARSSEDAARIDMLGVDLNGRSVAVLVEQDRKASSLVRALLCSEWLAGWGPQEFLQRLNEEATAQLHEFLLADVWQLNRDHRLIVVAGGHSSEVLWAAQNLRKQCRIDITLLCAALAADLSSADQYLFLRREFPATGDGWATLVRPQGKTGEVFDIDLAAPLETSQPLNRVETELPSRRAPSPDVAAKQEALRTLAGGLAEYLGHAIAAVDGSAELALQQAPRDPMVRQRFEEIGRAVEHVSKLNDELRIFAGRGPRSVERLDPARIVEQVMESLPSLALPNIKVSRDLDPDVPAVEGDLQQIARVLRNLLENAIESLPEQGGAISIRGRRFQANRDYLSSCLAGEDLPEGDYFGFEVTDTGFGMDGDLRTRVFDPFFTTKPTGRGLGLSVVLGIVRNHRGALQVESQPGKGTMVRVCFPLAKKAAASGPASDSPKGASIGNGRTVLVVEGQESPRTLAAEVFESHGFRVLAAADGWEALDVFSKKSETIDVVVLDWMMPDLDAEEAVRAIRRIRSDALIVVSGPFSKDQAERRFKGKKLAAYIEKPFRAESLSACIRTLSEEHQASSGATTG